MGRTPASCPLLARFLPASCPLLAPFCVPPVCLLPPCLRSPQRSEGDCGPGTDWHRLAPTGTATGGGSNARALTRT